MTDPRNASGDQDEKPAIDAEPESSPAAEAEGTPGVAAVEAHTTTTRSARGAVLIGARIVTGAVGVGVAALAIAAAVWLPIPSHTVKPLSAVVTPIAAAQQRVCAGPLLRLGEDSGASATKISSVGDVSVRYSQSAGHASGTELSSTDNTTGIAPELLTLPATGGPSSTPPLLFGSQSQFVKVGDLVGFASAECAEGSGDSWLVGGATDTGRTTLITLSNPSKVIGTVDLTIYSDAGPVIAAGTKGIVVPPGGQRVLSLAGFAPNVTSPVVHVQSRGGQIVANLQQSTVRTLEPGGVDIIGPTTDPSTLNVIAGFVVANSAATVARQPEPGYSDLRSIIRLFVPGNRAAKAEISIVPEVGKSALTPVRVSVPAGVVTDVPLDSLDDGSYTLSIATDQPIVAAARVSTVGTTVDASTAGTSDFAWVAADGTVSKRALVTIPPGPSPVLHIVNPTRAEAKVTIRSRGAQDIVVTVPAKRTIAQAVVAGGNYTLSGFDSLQLAVSYSGDGQLSTFRVTPTAPASRPIRIYP